MPFSFLIIAHARSGSTSLGKALAAYFNYPFIFEPWNSGLNYSIEERSLDSFPENSIVKALANQVPEEICPPDTFYPTLSFYENISSKFQHVLLLARKNKQEVYESTEFFHRKNTSEWHQSWSYDGCEISDWTRIYIDYQQEVLDALSTRLGLEFTWYEDLFSGDQERIEKAIHKWDIDINEFKRYLDPSKRYRQYV